MSDIPLHAGSIAEREHQKWKRAEDIPNNPYSPEVLQKRLSSKFSRDLDMERLVTKSQAEPVIDADDDGDESHRIVIGSGKPDISMYIHDLTILLWIFKLHFLLADTVATITLMTPR